MSTAWAGGSTRAHRQARARVLERDGGRCQVKIPGICRTIADQAHHTLGKGITGDDPAHMIASCAPCNQHVGDPTRHDPTPTVKTWW
jgi:hypothetical protein